LIKFILHNLLLFILLFLTGVAYFLFFTTEGLTVDLAITARILPGKLQVKHINGKLVSNFKLEGISYQSAQQDMRINSLSLAWNPAALLANQFDITAITINKATVTVNPTLSDSSKINFSQFDFLRHIHIGQIRLNNFILQAKESKIEINGTVTEKFNLTWKISIAQLKNIFSNASGSFNSSGMISGPRITPRINAVITGNQLVLPNIKISHMSAKTTLMIQPNINSTLNFSAKDISVRNYLMKQLEFNVTGNISTKNKKLMADLTTVINHQYSIIANLNFPKFSGFTLNQSINATLQSSLNRFDWLTTFIPQIKNPHGMLHATLIINGMLTHPALNAKIDLARGQFSLPILGITPDQIILHAESDLLKPVAITGSFRSGVGTAKLQGNLDFSQPNYPLSLTLQGDQLQAIALQEYKIVISPNIKLQFTQQNLQLDGTILIPTATIAPKNFSNTVTLPSDVVFAGRAPANNALPFTTSLRINLQLGEKIHLAYKDLTANLGGNIEINQTQSSTATATGELYTTNGTYKAYGQTLTIESGHLIYTGGSLMNPGLNIAATKQIRTIGMASASHSFTSQTTLQPVYTGAENITVGVRVQGTLNQPVFSLFSIPEFSQSDILSYLVLGYSQSQSSGQQGALLSALSALNPNAPGASKITKNLQDKLGFNELGVQSAEIFNPATNSTKATTTFVVGKQIGQHLSIHYSVGLFYPISILNLRYQLSKHWAIQSETSTIDNGADVLYAIERD